MGLPIWEGACQCVSLRVPSRVVKRGCRPRRFAHEWSGRVVAAVFADLSLLLPGRRFVLPGAGRTTEKYDVLTDHLLSGPRALLVSEWSQGSPQGTSLLGRTKGRRASFAWSRVGRYSM